MDITSASSAMEAMPALDKAIANILIATNSGPDIINTGTLIDSTVACQLKCVMGETTPQIILNLAANSSVKNMMLVHAMG